MTPFPALLAEEKMKQKNHNPAKRLFEGVLAVAWMLLAVVGPCMAEEVKKVTTPAEAMGEAARVVSEDSKAAYHGTKAAVVNSSREVVEGAKKIFREAKGAGTQAVKDVKKGFAKEPAAQP
jgi:hypothetical protein